MTLQNQPTKMPTRKIMAVILSGMVLGGVQSALSIFWPDHPFAPLMDQFDIWIQAGVMIASGYLVKEKVS
jgi:hypothetical protein